MTVALASAIVLVPLTNNFDRFTAVTTLQRDVYLAASVAMQGASGNPQVIGVEVSGSEAIVSVRPLPTDAAEIDELVKELKRSTDLDISLKGA